MNTMKTDTTENTQATHTLGPWKINRSVFSSQATTELHIGTPIHTSAVVYIDNLGKHSEEQEANARLIAAAPELLAALKLALGPLQQAQNTMRSVEAASAFIAARAAIAKAEVRA